MQDDQTKPADNMVKDEDVSSDISGLSLGSPPPADNSVTDPVLEAIEQKQSEPAADVAPTDSEEKPSVPVVEGEPPAPPNDAQAIDTAVPAPAPQGDASSLDPIKKEALQKLEPLVNELDLHPEEKYRALMMIIQATDNKELVNEAYQAADKIEDNKTRAQALLSIVNEIEYFKNKEIASSNQ